MARKPPTRKPPAKDADPDEDFIVTPESDKSLEKRMTDVGFFSFGADDEVLYDGYAERHGTPPKKQLPEKYRKRPAPDEDIDFEPTS